MAYLKSKTYSEHCQTSTMKRFAKNSYLAHFSAQLEKIKKICPPKKREMELSDSKIKKILIFPEMEPCAFQPKLEEIK